MRNEFDRGVKTIDRIITGKNSWSSLYESVNLHLLANLLITIAITDSNDNEREKAKTILESNIIGLTIQLEQLDVFVISCTQIEIVKNTAVFKLFLQLPADFQINLVEQIPTDFIARLDRVANVAKLDLYPIGLSS